jgi:zinc transporter ZupT
MAAAAIREPDVMTFRPIIHMAEGSEARPAQTRRPPSSAVLVAVLLAGVASVLGAVVALAMIADVAALVIAFVVLLVASGVVMATVYRMLPDREATER